jgi:hypothetical protein
LFLALPIILSTGEIFNGSSGHDLSNAIDMIPDRAAPTSCLTHFFDSAHRNFPLQKFTQTGRIYRRDPRRLLSANVSANEQLSR